MTIPEFVARQTERMAESLAHFIASTPADRLVWHPHIEGSVPTRSILEQASECIQVNRFFGALLRGGEVVPMENMPPVELDNSQDAQEEVVVSARELIASMRAMTDADLTRIYHLPRFDITGENLLLICYRNMAYHAGQANFIQTLYGDGEFHVPPTWR